VADIDTKTGELRVRRTYASGQVKSYGKTARSRRVVPLSDRAIAALDDVPRRIGSLQAAFAGPGGGYIDLHNFRAREWIPAVEAAGLGKGRRIYDLRHSFATWALDAGISLYELARFMGTSVRMIDLHYGHLMPGSTEAARAKLNAIGR